MLLSDKNMHQKDKYSALIVGAGRIGSDFDTPEAKKILTHAHAYRACGRTDIVGFVDADFSAAKKAVKRWGGRAFTTLEEAFREYDVDIVSVSSPDETHYDVLLQLASFAPKAVICEKPVTTDVNHTEEINQLYQQKNIALQVNYSRRFDPSVEQIQDALKNNQYGAILGAYGIYTKGLLHNGSHMVDLARFLFGEALDSRALSSRADYSFGDLSVSAFLRFERCPAFHLMVGDGVRFSIFELSIICEKGRIVFKDGGVRLCIEPIQDHSVYAGYRCLASERCEETELDSAMMNMIENTISHICTGAALRSPVQDALAVHRICNDLRLQLTLS